MPRIRKRLVIVTTFGVDKLIKDCFRLLMNDSDWTQCIGQFEDLVELHCTCEHPHQMNCIHGFDLLCSPSRSFSSQFEKEIKKHESIFK
jgi:hypothetical protein